MSTQRISFTLNGNVDSIERVVRRMLDGAGFTEVAFDMKQVGRGSAPKRGTVAKNRTIRVPDDIWERFQAAAAMAGAASVTDWLISAGEAFVDPEAVAAYQRKARRR